MTPVSDGVAVIATQLAQTDRRALSEAWYSALHLAGGTIAPRTAPHRVGTAPAAKAPAPATHDERERASAPLAQRSRQRPPGRASADAGVERRRPVGETARHIERAVTALAARRPLPVAHTVEIAGGRVRLLVHDDGRTTRIVALCSGPLREHVERALASARFSLAGAGVAVAAP